MPLLRHFLFIQVHELIPIIKFRLGKDIHCNLAKMVFSGYMWI